MMRRLRVYARNKMKALWRAKAVPQQLRLSVGTLRLAMLVTACALPVLWAQAQSRSDRRVSTGEAFPHARHARMFTSCEGCHANVANPARDSIFPTEAVCSNCHNGTDAKSVVWKQPPTPAGQSLLKFSHRSHFVRDSASSQCTSCHGSSLQNPGFMDVVPAQAAPCLSCHTQSASSHYDNANTCTTCHVELVQATTLTIAAVRSLPRPRSHDAANFVEAHSSGTSAQRAQCATCHTRESCMRCHPNAASVPQIASLGEDARVKEVVSTLLPKYPTPDTHSRDGFSDSHGAEAKAGVASCANCHTRPSCETCHTGQGGARVIRTLPDPRSGAQGVQLQRVDLRRVPHAEALISRGVRAVRMIRAAGPSVATDTVKIKQQRDTGVVIVRPHPVNFLDVHRTVAASGAQTCAGCHATRFCADCHAGESRRNFHPGNFVAGHAASTYARDNNCASCHNAEVFCRSCHVASGLGQTGQSAAVYHNAQPQWLLQHGRAARLELATCASCHTQRSCLKCHATTGWGVNPHGEDFNADRLGRKAMAMCARCHIADPRRNR